MGHTISYEVFTDGTPKEAMRETVLNIVHNSGDRYGTERIDFFDAIHEDQDAAEKWIEAHDRNGSYRGIAVRFYDYSGIKPTKKMLEIQAKVQETRQKAAAYAKEHSVKTFKATYVGCPHCGSRLKRELLWGEQCPLCRKDLRSNTTLTQIKKYEDKIQDLWAKHKKESQKDKKNAKICWLVKYEYHG